MKIVFLAPFGIRPKGTVISRMLPLAVELQARGHAITIIAPPYTNPEDSGRTELVRGVRLVNVSLPSAGKVLGALPLAWRMFRAMLREEPDLVHLFKPKGYGGMAAMLQVMLRRLGVRLPPLFLDTDDWEGKGGMNDLHSYSSAEQIFFAFQEQWLPGKSCGVTVASRTLGQLIGEMGIAADRILYLPNCAAETRPGDGARIRQKLGIAKDTPVVLLYTRFFEFSQQRLHTLFAEIHRRMPLVCFLVVGKGRHGEEELLRAAARCNGFEASLAMAGWLDPADIPDYLAAGDVAVYPLDDTLLNRAKCPAKLTELLQAGIPVVADAVGQAQEYINPSSDLLCQSADPEGMADRVVSLLQDGDKRKTRAVRQQAYLGEHFSWKEYAFRLEQFYVRDFK